VKSPIIIENFEALVKPFTAWEAPHRANPDKYLTDEQVKAMEAKTYGERCAEELLKHLGGN